MKLSRKSDYALRALFELVAHYGKGPLSTREIAERNFIPRRFLEQIMIDLRTQNWVRSIAGRDGGFVLARPPEEITMGEVVRHFDGILSPIACVSTTHYEPCPLESTCRFRRVLLEIRNFVVSKMDRATLAFVYSRSSVRHDEVFTPAFVGGDGI